MNGATEEAHNYLNKGQTLKVENKGQTLKVENVSALCSDVAIWEIFFFWKELYIKDFKQ